MDEHFAYGFFDELEKIGVDWSVLGPALGGAALGGAAGGYTGYKATKAVGGGKKSRVAGAILGGLGGAGLGAGAGAIGGTGIKAVRGLKWAGGHPKAFTKGLTKSVIKGGAGTRDIGVGGVKGVGKGVKDIAVAGGRHAQASGRGVGEGITELTSGKLLRPKAVSTGVTRFPSIFRSPMEIPSIFPAESSGAARKALGLFGVSR